MDTTMAQQILGQEHTGFSVWCERIVESDDTEGRLFLGRYLAKAPLALERIVLTEDAVVVNADRRKLPDWTGTPLEFLARLSAHIPGYYEHLERFFGRYSSATRGKRGDLAQTSIATEDAPVPPSAEAPRSCPRATRWATLMARLYELQPLQCLKCGAAMVLKAFITDPFEIQRFLQSLGIPPYRAPPHLPSHYQPPLPLFD
jgi:hypothetical protein